MASVDIAMLAPLPWGPSYCPGLPHHSRPLGIHSQSAEVQNASTSVEDGWVDRQQRTSLLDLPLEIRLQIYAWVHLLHPFKYRELAPGYPAPAIKPYRPSHIPPPYDSTADPATPPRVGVLTPLLNPHRPFGYMPASLLLANRQIYHEAREIPYLENEFVFDSFLSSALAIADVFARKAAPWQRCAMRYVRLEMGLTNLSVLRTAWGEIGEALVGVKGLRLRLKADAKGLLGLKGPEPGSEAEFCARELASGLVRMKALRQVEVEVVGTSIAGIGFTDALCQGVQNILDEERREKVSVVAVMKLDMLGKMDSIKEM